MIRSIVFTKMSGAGNDFIVVDNLDGSIDFDKSRLAVALCSRLNGIGADGLLLMEPSAHADFFMRYHNADGSYGGMCGNGGRCIARYANLAGLTSVHTKFEALDFVYAAEVSGPSVKLWMKAPNDIRLNLLVESKDKKFSGHYIDTGSPHFVLQTADLDAADVVHIGSEIRYHRMFAPEGCNVNFVSLKASGVLSIRTYERGVEAETLACGTGSVASAIVFASQYGLKSPVTLDVRSGEQLLVYFDFQDGEYRNVVLEGSAHMIFSGRIEYDPQTGRIVDPLILTSAKNL